MTDIVTRNPPIKPFLDRFWPCGDLRHNRWNFPVSVISNSRGASYQQCLLKRLFWKRAYKTVQQFVQHFYLEADIDSISDPREYKSLPHHDHEMKILTSLYLTNKRLSAAVQGANLLTHMWASLTMMMMLVASSLILIEFWVKIICKVIDYDIMMAPLLSIHYQPRCE